MTSADYRLYGMLMSPYSMKMRAYLRYRRIPFRWVNSLEANTVAQTKVSTYMVPVLENPEGVFKNDSTHMITELEGIFPERRADPENEADCFLAHLIEDFADEWLVSPFFLHRWREKLDQKHSSQWIIYEALEGNLDPEKFTLMSDGWKTRQIGLLPYVCGQSDVYDILDESLHAFLRIIENAVSSGLFFFGTRPSRAEFGIYGQLSQLIQDATARDFMHQDYNLTARWVSIIDDLSGKEGDWEPLSTDAGKLSASPVVEILKLCGKYHLPMLQANLEAIESGNQRFAFDVDNRAYARFAHNRHSPCLPALQKRYMAISPDSKEFINTVLADTGCLQYLTSS